MIRYLRPFLFICLVPTLPIFTSSSVAQTDKGICKKQITYKSATDDGYKYLEGLQREVYESNPQLVDPFLRGQLNTPRAVTTFAQLKELAVKACPDLSHRSECALDPILVDKLMAALPCLALPTRYESPFFSSLIDLYSEDLARIRQSRFPNSSGVRFGSLPTGTFGAQAILPPHSKVPVVILNRDVFFFTGAFSKSISDAIPITIGEDVRLDSSEGAIRKRLREHPYIIHNFADAMAKLVRNGSSVGAKEITLDEDHNHLHARLVTAMDTFIIAHEDAHVILNHVSDQSVEFHLAGGKSGSVPMPFAAGSTDLKRKTESEPTVLMAEVRTRQQEFDADALGFKLLIWSEEQEGDPIGVMVAAAAPHIVFRILDAAADYGKQAGGWTFADANHPSAPDRVKALVPVFDETAKSDPLLRQVDFRVPFDAAFKVLLAQADPEIRQKLSIGLKKPN